MEARSIIALVCVLGLAAKSATSMAFSDAELTSLATGKLNSCEKAIWSCCQHDRPQTQKIPENCFEINGCYGLHWLGQEACSQNLLNAVGRQIETYKKEIEEKGKSVHRNRIRYY